MGFEAEYLEVRNAEKVRRVGWQLKSFWPRLIYLCIVVAGKLQEWTDLWKRSGGMRGPTEEFEGKLS